MGPGGTGRDRAGPRGLQRNLSNITVELVCEILQKILCNVHGDCQQQSSQGEISINLRPFTSHDTHAE